MPEPLELIVLFTAIVMGSVGQISMKAGMNAVREKSGGDLGPIVPSLIKAFSNLRVVFGIGIYVLSTVLWLWVLKKIPLSFAYPCISVSYIIIIFAGRLLFRERIDRWKIGAIILILSGVIFMGLSESRGLIGIER